MKNGEKLRCLDCDWEATIDTDDPPVEASQAAIDHHLVFGHAIERTDMAGTWLYENSV